MIFLLLLGFNEGKAKKYCKINLILPIYTVTRIQESHIFIGHYLETFKNMILKKR